MAEQTTQSVPSFLLKQQPTASFAVTDELALVVTSGEKTITLARADQEKLRAFLARFEHEEVMSQPLAVGTVSPAEAA